MSWSRLLVLALAGAFLAAPAWAQDDDDLAPLTPKKKTDAPKAKAKPAAPKAKPAPTAAKPKPAPAATPDEDLAPLAPSKGELVLKLAATSNTRKAKVSIDDKEIGTLPFAAQSMGAGEHTVWVRAPGFAVWSKKITVTANKTTELSVALEANAALLTITADSPGAAVLINGRQVGIVPLEELEVAPGSTTILVRKEGFKDATTNAKLVAGREYPISVRLTPAPPATAIVAQSDRPENTTLTPTDGAESPLGVEASYEPTPVYKRWYVWTGVAVVVAAAVAVGVGVSVSNKPKSLGEKEICGGMCDACIGFSCAASGIMKF